MKQTKERKRGSRSSHCYAVIAFELDVARWKYGAAQDEARKVAQQLIRDITQAISLRELSRRLSKSPTYISQVSTGKIAVSDDVFLMMVNVLEDLNNDAN